MQQVDTAGYRMVLAVGDREAMFTQDEVDANCPMSGKLMVAGTMMDPATQTHYGNNVPMAPGARMVTFTVNGQTATFTVGQ